MLKFLKILYLIFFIAVASFTVHTTVLWAQSDAETDQCFNLLEQKKYAKAVSCFSSLKIHNVYKQTCIATVYYEQGNYRKALPYAANAYRDHQDGYTMALYGSVLISLAMQKNKTIKNYYEFCRDNPKVCEKRKYKKYKNHYLKIDELDVDAEIVEKR